MKTKNHIKVKGAKNNSLRGIGKLNGWSESATMFSTLRRLIATFTSDRYVPKTKVYKKETECPVCKKKFHLNNTSRIPTHTGYRSYFYKNNVAKCKGSWSEQLSDRQNVIEQDSIFSILGKIKVGDKFLIDFSRAILREIDDSYSDLFETTLEKIIITENLKNNNAVYSFKESLYFKGVKNPIPNNSSYLRHAIKIEE